SYDQLIGRIYQKDVDAVVGAIDDHLEHKWPLKVEFRMLNNHQQFEWIYMTGQAQWQGDKAIRLAGTLTNISDRKKIEQQLKQREWLIEQMIDALPISIYVKDAQGCYQFFNKEAEKLTGKRRGQMLGRTDFEVYPIPFALKQATKDKEIQATEKVVLFEEEALFNEQKHWLLFGKVPVHIKQFDQSYETWLLSFALDITERKEMEEELKTARTIAEQAAKAKADFLSVMSHEIRTPLNSVIGNSSLLLSEELDPHLAEHIEMIKRSGDHLLYLINDILDFNKLEAGKVELEQRPFDLSQQVQTVLEMSMTNAKLKHIYLNAKLSDELDGHYLGDEGRLRQVLLNLVGNAIKFTDTGGVELAVFLKQPLASNNEDSAIKTVRFEVTDTGIGIAEENIPKLFAEFSQADSSTSRRFGGSGLGLSISKKLVEAMQGEIGINSIEGKGSTFWFEIPLEVFKEPQTKRLAESRDVASFRPLSILVAEDNLPNQFLIKTILTKLGHSVEIANNGLEAYEIVQDSTKNFDLVLMDMQMPEMNGLESTQHIRMLPGHLGNIPIVALSANSYEESYEAVIASGMNDYLSKPVNIETLKKTLAKWSAI
ncbi:MAG: ATP-binding protein, partial [Thiomicrorhabdus sp.]|nr:ATP-binding protein [Thiomicrorhabdus sp.]